MTIALPQATKDRLLPLLDDPNNWQTLGLLCSISVPGSPRFCCLGLYAIKGCGAHVYRDEGADCLTIDVPGYGNVNHGELLDQAWADQHGITQSHQALLSSLNDGRATAVIHSDPLIEVWRKIGVDVSMFNGKRRCGPDQSVFHPHRRTFAEIAKVIREHL